ncbi:MFS transporter [Pueribacillus sp. YX66]|uniref:MFS transporter n=1 Tax=Pueribacillus sp. YX66 TaxID=3229242 RepID=UPI00358D7164
MPTRHDYVQLGIIAAFFMIGMMGTRPLVPLFTNELGASSIQIGIVVSMFPFLSLLFAVRIGKIVDRVGSKTPIMLSAVIGSLALMIPFFSTHLFGIILSQLAAGIANTVFVVSAQSYAGHSSTPSEREQNILKFSIGAAIGSFVGPLAGGLLADMLSISNAFFILSLVGLLSLVFVASLTPYEMEDKQKQQPLGSVFATFYLLKIRNVRRAFLISSLVLLGKDMFAAYFPLLGLQFGLSSTSIGVIVSINALAGIFIRLFMPQLIEMLGRANVILLSIVSSGLFFVLMPLSHNAVWLGVLSFLLGVGLGIGQPLTISTTLQSLPRDRVAEGLGFRLTSNRLTQTVAPFAFGIVAQSFGMISVFLVTGALILLGSTKSKIDESALC